MNPKSKMAWVYIIGYDVFVQKGECQMKNCEKIKRIEKIQTSVVVFTLIIIVVSIPFVCKKNNRVEKAYNSFRNSLIVFDLEGWENALNGLTEGANDIDFVKSVNSYQDRVQYLKKLELAEEPYFAESMALKEAMQDEITIGRTYKAWGNMDPNLIPIIYVGILLIILIEMVIVRIVIEIKKNDPAK